MKYKIGDKVKIHGVTDHRKGFNGKEVIIKKINPNGSGGNLKKNITHYGVGEVYVFWEDELVPVNTRKIVITSDGVETLARLYDGNKVIKSATAKCSPSDTFDFETGARLAFDRLTETKSPLEETLEKMRKAVTNFKIPKVEVKLSTSKYKAGDKVKIIKNTCHHGMDIGEVVTLDRVFDNNVNTAWFTKEYKTGWYIRESDFEPYNPPKYYNGKVVCVKKGYEISSPVSFFTVGKIYNVINGVITSDQKGWRSINRYETIERLCRGIGYEFIPLVE